MREEIAALCATLADEVDHIGMPMRMLVAGRVEDGTLKPEDAEDWAREVGEEPFKCEPDPVRFDPMAEPDWTLAMAAAWSAWRSPEAVQKVWAPFLENCLRWVPCDDTMPRPHAPGGVARITGHRLLPPELRAPNDVLQSIRTASAMAATGWNTDAPLMEADKVERHVRAALRAGVPLIARHGTMAEVIDRHVWSSLSPFDDGRGGPEDVHDHSRVVRFYRVRVERDAVLAVWPPVPVDDVFAMATGEAVTIPKADAERLNDTFTSTMRGEEARGFIAKENPPSGLSLDALVAWATKKADAIGWKIDREDVRTYHRSTAYVGTKQRGRPRKSAE